MNGSRVHILAERRSVSWVTAAKCAQAVQPGDPWALAPHHTVQIYIRTPYINRHIPSSTLVGLERDHGKPASHHISTRSPLYYDSNMRHRMPSHKFLFPADFQLSSASQNPPPKGPQSVYDAWLASRELPGQPGHYLVPGAPRRLTTENARLALYITQTCTFDFVSQANFFLALFRLFMAVHAAQGAVRPQPLQNSSHDDPKCRSKHFPSFPRLLSGLSQQCFTQMLYLHSLPGSDSRRGVFISGSPRVFSYTLLCFK